MGLFTVIVLSWSLAAACFIAGNIPLFFTLSQKRIAQLSTVGIGLLLGAALGVIIPEGVESIFEGSSADPDAHPDRTVAFALISGFMLMLIVEQVLIPAPDSSSHEYALAPSGSLPEAARSSSNLHRLNRDRRDGPDGGEAVIPNANFARARSVTFGLVIHSLADGLALGASTYASPSSTAKSLVRNAIRYVTRAAIRDDGTLVPDAVSRAGAGEIETTNPLTLVVFLALVVHKIPTALALSTSLLSLIPANRIRLHIAAFSIATPIGALISYVAVGLFEVISAADGTRLTPETTTSGRWAGIALAFSGGTFLYVATVLQPVRSDGGHHGHVGEDEIHQLGRFSRTALIILGMLIPIWVTIIVGHGH